MTGFKIVSEYIISFILLASIIMLLKNRKEFDSKVLRWLIISFILTIGAEIAFTFYVSVYGLSNFIGHIFKLVAFFFIYLGIIETGVTKPYSLLFRELNQSIETIKRTNKNLENIVTERTIELQKSNDRLRAELSERKLVQKEIRELNQELEQRVAERTADLDVAKDRAESADRLKSAFLATMSHELRTPLNSIIGFTGILLQNLVGPLNEEQNKQLKMVQGSAHHLLNLINDVLDISKIEAGQLEIVSKPFDMRQAIQTVVETIAPSAEKRGLELISSIAPQVGIITSDKRRVEQILLNLLNNAVKFTEHGEVRLECAIEKEWLVTRVIDTGIGIQQKDLDLLFKPFQQVDTGITRNHEGTGLGLSICKRLVEILGGKIWVESQWGQGSSFTFTLPFERTQI